MFLGPIAQPQAAVVVPPVGLRGGPAAFLDPAVFEVPAAVFVGCGGGFAAAFAAGGVAHFWGEGGGGLLVGLMSNYVFTW